MKLRVRISVAAAICGAALTLALIALRLTGLLIPYRVPSEAMNPTLVPGDQFVAEGITYLTRRPSRGDVVAFATAGIPGLADEVFVKRVAGLPGDRVRIADGKLFINDEHVILANAEGEIRYANLPRSMYLSSPEKGFTVPPDSYFVLGDNSPESADSRHWGCVPAKNILSRVWFCYFPLGRMRTIK